MNRDNNGMRNIKLLTEHYKRYLEGHEKEPRPEEYCRDKNNT